MRVVVTGATGCVGRAVTEALAARGDTVVAAARRPPPRSKGVEPLAFDLGLEGGGGSDAWFAGAGAVVHLGARAHTVPRTPRELDEMRRTNVDGTRRLVDAAKKHGARLVYASTVAVYGDRHGDGAVGDDAATTPHTPYGVGKLEAEEIVRADKGLALRLALVFGPGDRGNVATLLGVARARRAFVIGRGENRKSIVYAANIADRVLRLLDLPPADFAPFAGGARNVVDASPTQRELVDAIAIAAGRRPPPALPIAPLLLAGSAIDLGMRALGRTPRWRERVKKLAQATVYDGGRLDRELGYTPRVGLRDGLAAEARDLWGAP